MPSVQKPSKLAKKTPAEIKRAIDKLVDYSVATHLDRVIIIPPPSDAPNVAPGATLKTTSSGTNLELSGLGGPGGPGGADRFSFVMTDASDNTGHKILILDGEVFGPNDIPTHDGHTPLGMGNDDYILPIQNTDGEVWLIIPLAPGTFNIIDPITLDQGTTTPDDIDNQNQKIEYVRIGIFQYSTDTPPQLTITNTLCGDYFIVDNSGPSDHYSFQIVDASDEAGYPAVLIYDGLINDTLPDGMGGDDFILPATDGMTIYAGIAYDTDTFEINSRYVASVDAGSNPPDDTFGFFTVILGGCSVTYDAQNNAAVNPFNSHCGDLKFSFAFGAFNGLPSMLPVLSPSDWVQIPPAQ